MTAAAVRPRPRSRRDSRRCDCALTPRGPTECGRRRSGCVISRARFAVLCCPHARARAATQLHYPDDEPSGPQITPELFDFERFNVSGDELKKEILQEIWLYHRERMRAAISPHRREPYCQASTPHEAARCTGRVGMETESASAAAEETATAAPAAGADEPADEPSASASGPPDAEADDDVAAADADADADAAAVPAADAAAAAEEPPPPPPVPTFDITFGQGPMGMLVKESSIGLMVVHIKMDGAAMERGVKIG